MATIVMILSIICLLSSIGVLIASVIWRRR